MYQINLCIKRFFDVIFAGVLIVFLLPLWIGVFFAIKKESKGPVFFRQGRRTKNGRIFQMLKFRTMVVNAEQMGPGLFNYENDPRVTRVGRKMRDNSIDELPQLFNILKGDMSVVGPRPCVSYELGDFETLNERYRKRFQVKAGLTGLAQVRGRNNISWEEKVVFDNQYVDKFRKYGVFIDIAILIESIFKVLKKENIYEKKKDEAMSGEESAKAEEAEIIRCAHLPD